LAIFCHKTAIYCHYPLFVAVVKNWGKNHQMAKIGDFCHFQPLKNCGVGNTGIRRFVSDNSN